MPSNRPTPRRLASLAGRDLVRRLSAARASDAGRNLGTQPGRPWQRVPIQAEFGTAVAERPARTSIGGRKTRIGGEGNPRPVRSSAMAAVMANGDGGDIAAAAALDQLSAAARPGRLSIWRSSTRNGPAAEYSIPRHPSPPHPRAACRSWRSVAAIAKRWPGPIGLDTAARLLKPVKEAELQNAMLAALAGHASDRARRARSSGRSRNCRR